MKCIFIACILVTIFSDVTNTLRIGEKTTITAKDAKTTNGTLVEGEVATTAGKDDNITIPKKLTSIKGDNEPSPDSANNANSVLSSAKGQDVPAPTNIKSQKVPKSNIQEQFSLEALEAMNQKRKSHGVKPLVLNEKLTNMGQKMALKLAKMNDINAKIPVRKDVGQNVYYMISSTPNVKLRGNNPIENWYSKFRSYDFSKEPTKSEAFNTGNFSQMIWKDTTDVGIAYAQSDDKKLIFVVALFSPKGNLVGEFKDQVLPLEEIRAEEVEVGAAAQSGTEEDFNEGVLRAHNKYRKLHHSPPLKLNNELNIMAQAWANKLAGKDKMVHSTNRKYGENLYMAWSSDTKVKPKANDTVDDWYNEILLYNYQKPKFDTKTGHFTQVVWKSSLELGVGMAQSKKSRKFYIVTKYNKPGNYVGKFKANVLPKEQ